MHYGSIIDRKKGAGSGGDSSSSTFERYFWGAYVLYVIFTCMCIYVHVPELCVKNVIMIQQQVHQPTTIVNQI